MNDFGNEFASIYDPLVFDCLGDTVSLSHPTLGSKTIQCEFDRGRIDDHNSHYVDEYFPTVLIKDADYDWFKDRTVTLTYNGELYDVFDDEPTGKLLHRIFLRDDR